MATPFDTTDEDQFTMGRPSIARLDLRERISKQQENPNLIASDLEREELKEEEDVMTPIDMNDPLVKFIRGRTEAAKTMGQPTELQKKYEEMGLEYDYQKREETGSVWSDPEKQLQEVNPDFVQRNRDAFINTDLRNQLRQKTQEEMGRLDAAELKIWSDPALAETSYGKTAMRMIRSRQAMIQSLTEAEDAKLDGRFYDELPEKDRPVANMLFSSGITGRSMTTLTVNNGNIRDTISEAVLQVPEDKREEFKQRLLGDYIRDDQGNIIRNALGEELRKGGDFVSLTPYGTYDYKISDKAYGRGINSLVSQYQGDTGETRIKDLNTTISNIDSELNTRGISTERKTQLENLKKQFTQERTDLSLTRMGGESFARTTNEPFVSEETTQRPIAEQPVVTETMTETVTEAIPEQTRQINTSRLDGLIQASINENLATRGEDGLLIPASGISSQEKERIKRINEALKSLK
jgi:hypothetical protein